MRERKNSDRNVFNQKEIAREREGETAWKSDIKERERELERREGWERGPHSDSETHKRWTEGEKKNEGERKRGEK